MVPKLLLGFGLAAQIAATQVAQTDPYEAGLQLIEAQDVEGALQLWIALQDSASSSLQGGDPRIATAFVEAVAMHGLDRYEEVATTMFYWGFSSGTSLSGPARDEILAEGRRTFALTDSATAALLVEAGERDAGALALAIKKFWIERDPTPTTPWNERLSEHWQRVAYARRNHTHNRSSPYGTDDRGVFHVKYGTPDRITRGTANVSSAEQRQYGISTDFVARFDRSPQYEIWRYATMHRGEFTYFLFGNVGGTGPFTHVRGLHEILPSSARLPPSLDPNSPLSRGIRPWHYLELLYYDDLARMGGPFGLRFGELERLWNRSREPNEGLLEAASQRFLAEDNWAAAQPRPTSASELDDSPKSALSAQVARILHGAEPRLLAFAVSSPLWRPTIAETESGDSLYLAPYAARHTVVVRDRHLDEIHRAGMVASDAEANVATTVLRHAPSIAHLTVTARHDVAEADTTDAGPGVLPGHVHFDVAQPLRLRSSELEVSDLILGIGPRLDLEIADLGVPLLPARQFWHQDLLRVYFEVYHGADLVAGSVQRLDVRVSIVPAGDAAEPGGGGPPPGEGQEDPGAISVSLESTAPVGRHHLDLDLRNEAAGALWIVVEVADQETGATRLRAAPMLLLEN